MIQTTKGDDFDRCVRLAAFAVTVLMIVVALVGIGLGVAIAWIA